MSGLGTRLSESNVVVSKKDYIAALRRVIRQMHHCDGTHSRSVRVQETFQGKTVWDGEVEVFDLADHPQANNCYAWGRLGGKDQRTHYVTVLAIPPVTTALAAVKASMLADSKAARS